MDWKLLRKQTLILEEFRKLDPEMQMQTALTFLYIAERGEEGLPMRDLQDKLGLARSSTSRNVAALSALHRKGVPGHDLISTYENPEDRKQKIAVLTPKGKRFLNTIVAFLEQ